MRDRLARPPPLILTPPKIQHTIAIRESFVSATKGSRAPCHWAAYAESSQPENQGHSSGRSTSRRHVWFSIAGDVVHIHLCAILMAAMATYLYQVPSSTASLTGHVAIAAIIFLSLDILLSILSILLRPEPSSATHTSYGPSLPGWAILLRLVLAAGLTSLFITWLSHSPTTRVFEPGYRLWDMAPTTSNEFVVGTVFVVAVWDAIMVVLGRKGLSWRNGHQGDEKLADEETRQEDVEALRHPGTTRRGTSSERMLGGSLRAWWSRRRAGKVRSGPGSRSPPGSAISLGWFRLNS